MYVTRPLSLYRRDPSALSLHPPEGPNSGILVIQDEEAPPACCFGLFECEEVADLPFPQNKNLRVRGVDLDYPVIFIPVLNQPLSSNLYYVLERHGMYKGKAHVNSREDDIETCCFCPRIHEKEPKDLDPNDIYQQFEIRKGDQGVSVAKSVAPDGLPPSFLRTKGWGVLTSTIYDFKLNEAPGLDSRLRARLPDFNFPLSQTSSESIVVGKWYCPFMFVKEGNLKNQIKYSRYYEMTLQQMWEQIFAHENSMEEGNVVTVDVVVKTVSFSVGGREAVVDEKNVVDGAIWFSGLGNVEGEDRVGLSLAIVERIKWEEERAGWIGGEVRVKRVEECGEKRQWRKFGCYALVEKFVLRRMDGSLVLTCDYRHTNQIRTKWD